MKDSNSGSVVKALMNAKMGIDSFSICFLKTTVWENNWYNLFFQWFSYEKTHWSINVKISITNCKSWIIRHWQWCVLFILIVTPIISYVLHLFIISLTRSILFWKIGSYYLWLSWLCLKCIGYDSTDIKGHLYLAFHDCSAVWCPSAGHCDKYKVLDIEFKLMDWKEMKKRLFLVQMSNQDFLNVIFWALLFRLSFVALVLRPRDIRYNQEVNGGLERTRCPRAVHNWLLRCDWPAAVRGADASRRSGGMLLFLSRPAGGGRARGRSSFPSRRSRNMWAAAAAAAVAVKNMATPLVAARVCRLAGRTVTSLSTRHRRAVSLPERRCLVSTSTRSSEFMFRGSEASAGDELARAAAAQRSKSL